MMMDERTTARTRVRYQRIAPFYDAMELFAERRYADWRPRLWSLVQGPAVLEVGVGAGKNMPYYPACMNITAIDLTPGMLEQARKRALELSVNANLQLGDVQNLNFPDNTFDNVIATFVFCSVPDPILGLNEIARVLKPGGRLLLLEHIRAANPVVGMLMDALNLLVVHMMGANINRCTVENLRRSRLQLEQVEDLGTGGIFKLIVARSQE